MSTIYQTETAFTGKKGASPKPAKVSKRSRYPLCNLYPEELEVVEPAVAGGGAAGLVTTVTNEMGLVFPDGAEYRGEVKDKKPHGKGTYVRPDGSYHNGAWVNGLPHGYGVARYRNGDTYRGNFAGGKRSEQGVYQGSQYGYSGEWRNGAMHGAGQVRWLNSGHVYEGAFAGNRPEGTGSISYPDGSRYEGGLAGGKCQGRGVLTLPTGARYAGDWAANVPVKAGVYTDPSGNTVPGQWTDGQFVPKRG